MRAFSLPWRLPALLTIVLGLLLPVLAVTALAPSGAQAAPAAAAPETSESHPFSAPRYLPVQGKRVFMDCYQNNHPGMCPKRDWQMNLLATELNEIVPVHAMGAGRFSLLQVGKPCGQSTTASFGTMVQIDHGGGIVSRYTHLNNRDLDLYRRLDGTLVAAGQRIGTMGNTGSRNPNNSPTLCQRNYLDFWVQRGPGADKIEIESLIACVDGEEQVWPREMYPNHPTWNQLPKHIRPGVNTVLPTDARADELPDASCLPGGAPATQDPPVPATLDRGGNNRLLARWAAPASDTLQSVLMVQIWRAPLRKWNTEAYHYVPGTAAASYLRADSAMANGRKVRVMLAHRNAAGWSRWSNLSNERIVGTAPNAPRIRSLKTFRARTSGSTILGWSHGGANGYPVIGWVAQVRLGTTGTWRSYTLPLKTYSYRFNNLAPGRRYQVRVAARSGAGLSPYLARAVTAPR